MYFFNIRNKFIFLTSMKNRNILLKTFTYSFLLCKNVVMLVLLKLNALRTTVRVAEWSKAPDSRLNCLAP